MRKEDCFFLLIWLPLVFCSFVFPVEAVVIPSFLKNGRHLRSIAAKANNTPSSQTPATNHTAFIAAVTSKTAQRDFLSAVESCTESCCQQFSQCPLCEVCTSGKSNPFSFLPASVQYVLMILLIFISAMFAGLTLGVMGLDKTGLEIVMHSDDATNAAYARKIYPLRANGNLLLCTLLIGNTAANALFSILIADKAGGIIGFISSTFLILIFAEIVPQSICSRYALYIGSRAVPLVRVIMFIMYPIAKPIAYCLDCALGEELATTYSGNEMLKFLQIHVEENVLDKETANTMGGALKYKNVAVRDVMTPLANVFMLKADEELNFETIATIFKTGYSRIPVYEVSKNNVVGLLFVKDLIFVDPEDSTRVADFIDIFGRGVHVVWPDDKLGDVLRELKQGRSHMALVRDVSTEDETQDPFYEVTGIITLEDIIEEILGHEIVDETDAFLDGTHSVKVDRADAFNLARLRLLDSKIFDERLSLEETRAVTAHLWKNFPAVVSLLTENQLHRLIAETPVSVLPTATQESSVNLPPDLLYEKDVPDDVCTLVLSGKVTVLVGADEFRSEVSSWGLLAAGALSNPDYRPDFSAFVSTGPCRCIRITRARYSSAVDVSTSERTQQQQVSFPSSGPANQDNATAEPVASRKFKLLTALRAVDNDSNHKDVENESSSSVTFAEPGTLHQARCLRAKSLLTATSRPNKPAQDSALSEASSSRFEFIGRPSSSMRRPDKK